MPFSVDTARAELEMQVLNCLGGPLGIKYLAEVRKILLLLLLMTMTMIIVIIIMDIIFTILTV